VRWRLTVEEAGVESSRESGDAGSGGGVVEAVMGDRVRSSLGSVSRSSSASHLRLAAFRVCLAGGEAKAAGEGSSSDEGGGAGSSGGGMGPTAAEVGARLRLRRHRRAAVA
jgi:hypothetical protein